MTPGREDLTFTLGSYRTKDFGPNDRLIVFVSGRAGIDASGITYYEDSNGAKPNFSAIENRLNAIPCEQILLILDTEYSNGKNGPDGYAFDGDQQGPAVGVSFYF